MITRLQARWRAYSAKKRRILTGLAIMTLALIIYSFILLPLQKSRTRLVASLLQKQSQLQEMKMEAARISGLRRAYQTVKDKPAELKASVEVSARLHGLGDRIGQPKEDGGGNVELSVPAISFDAWAAWIEALQSEHQIRVKRCLIEPAGEAGSVKIRATLTAS